MTCQQSGDRGRDPGLENLNSRSGKKRKLNSGKKCVLNHDSTNERLEEGDLTEFGVARKDFLEEAVRLGERHVSSTLQFILHLSNHMKFLWVKHSKFYNFTQFNLTFLLPFARKRTKAQRG